MTVSVIPGRELTPDLQAIWAGMQEGNPDLASPYFCSEYTLAVASVRDDVHIGIVEDGGVIAGFFPFQRDWKGAGRPVGGPLSDYHGIIGTRGCECDVQALLRECRLAVWDFDHLVASQEPFRPYHKRIAESPFMDLSQGYQAYASGRREAGSRQIRDIETLSRRLERDAGPLRFELNARDEAVLRSLMNWKSDQYLRSNLVDVFGFAWTRNLLKRICTTETIGFAGTLSALYAGQELVAVHMGMRSKDVWHYWFPSYDRKYARYSPGLILLLRMAQSAQSLGAKRIDLGKGDALYKSRLRSGGTALAEGSVEASSLVSFARRMRAGSERLLRGTTLFALARVPGRLVRLVQRSMLFR